MKKKRVVPAGYTRKKKLNEFIDCGDHYEIVVHSKRHGEVRAKISSCDYERCKEKTWGALFAPDNQKLYFYTHWKNPKKGSKALHRFIMDAPDNMMVDHINLDTQDNRRENLRICSRKVNRSNLAGAHKNNKLGVRNVYKDKYRMKYCVNVQNTYLGSYDTLDEANIVALKERIRIWNNPIDVEELANLLGNPKLATTACNC